VFFALALMSLCHSLVEDTILMVLLGGHVSGVLIGRAVFSLAVVFLLVRILARVSDAAFAKHFCRAAKSRPRAESAEMQRQMKTQKKQQKQLSNGD